MCAEGDGDFGFKALAAELVTQEELHEDGETEAAKRLIDLAREGHTDLFTVVLDVGEELWRDTELRGKVLLAALLAFAQGADHLPKAHRRQALFGKGYGIEGLRTGRLNRRAG